MPFHGGGCERYRFRQGAREGKAGRRTATAIFQHLIYVSAARRGGAFQHLPKGGESCGGEGFSSDAAHGVASGLIHATKAAPRAPVQPTRLPEIYAKKCPAPRHLVTWRWHV